MSAPREPDWAPQRPSRRKLIRGPIRTRRKDPKTDPRDLLANENAQFHEPEYLNDIGYHLQRDVLSLREEVQTLQRKLDLYVSVAESDGKTPVEKICSYDPSSDVEWGLSAKLRELEAQKQALKTDLRRLNMFFAEGTEDQLNADIVTERQLICDEEKAIGSLKDALSEKMSELRNVMQGSRRGTYGRQTQKIDELRELLDEMKQDEEIWMAEHERLFNGRPRDDEGIARVARLRRKLDTLVRSKQRRMLEVEKLKKNMALQKQGVKDSVKVRRLHERWVRQETEWNDNFRIQQKELREERRVERKRQKEELIEREMKEKEAMAKTTRKPKSKREDQVSREAERKVPTRRRHRRKRVHFRTDIVEEEDMVETEGKEVAREENVREGDKQPKEEEKDVEFKEGEDAVQFNFGEPIVAKEEKDHQEEEDHLDNDVKDITERIRSAISERTGTDALLEHLKMGNDKQLDEFGLTESMVEQSESCVSPRNIGEPSPLAEIEEDKTVQSPEIADPRFTEKDEPSTGAKLEEPQTSDELEKSLNGAKLDEEEQENEKILPVQSPEDGTADNSIQAKIDALADLSATEVEERSEDKHPHDTEGEVKASTSAENEQSKNDQRDGQVTKDGQNQEVLNSPASNENENQAQDGGNQGDQSSKMAIQYGDDLSMTENTEQSFDDPFREETTTKDAKENVEERELSSN